MRPLPAERSALRRSWLRRSSALSGIPGPLRNSCASGRIRGKFDSYYPGQRVHPVRTRADEWKEFHGHCARPSALAQAERSGATALEHKRASLRRHARRSGAAASARVPRVPGGRKSCAPARSERRTSAGTLRARSSPWSATAPDRRTQKVTPARPDAPAQAACVCGCTHKRAQSPRANQQNRTLNRGRSKAREGGTLGE